MLTGVLRVRRPLAPFADRTYCRCMGGILVVDDDSTVGGVVLSYLQRADLEGRHLDAGGGLHAIVSQMNPDLLVLDVMLPDADGIQLCAEIRRSNPSLPVILLTARSEEMDRIAGLTAGADDYVVKPFSPRELVLRIQSVLRRSQTARAVPDSGEPMLSDGDLILDRRSRLATRAGEALALTSREFDLLAHLLEHPGEALTREQLLRDVWEWSYGDKSTVTVHVRRLREKVEADPANPRRLVTVWGVGYRWDRSSETLR
jgi:DNA-binding response OmpR family regulator